MGWELEIYSRNVYCCEWYIHLLFIYWSSFIAKLPIYPSIHITSTYTIYSRGVNRLTKLWPATFFSFYTKVNFNWPWCNWDWLPEENWQLYWPFLLFTPNNLVYFAYNLVYLISSLICFTNIVVYFTNLFKFGNSSIFTFQLLLLIYWQFLLLCLHLDLFSW